MADRKEAMTMAIIRAGVLAIVLGLVACGDDDDGSGTPLNDDLECTVEEFEGPKATGTLTNDSSEPSRYTITVSFLDATGTRVAEGMTSVDNVQPDETRTWEVFANEDRGGNSCRVMSVQRQAQ
jgi:hypothetical protein